MTLESNTSLHSVRMRGATGVGILVPGQNVSIGYCDVSGSGGGTTTTAHGVHVTHGTPTGIVINNCNLVANGGNGIHNNSTTTQVDGTGNWWGDGQGPTGPSGDGVAGNVNTAGYLSGPVLLPYLPRP